MGSNPIVATMNKFIEEAKQCKIDFSSFIDMDYVKKHKINIMESVRFKYNDETDEEYNAYLKEFNKRYKMAR